jgi:DeoR/GlpR family transcriptional regulator of sugar metabolism
MLIKRQRELLELIQSEPVIAIQDLTDRLGVSSATVRRDLSALSAQGLIQRVRGGAMMVDPLGVEPTWIERGRREVARKRQIAQAACDMIEDGQVVALDVGTTTLEIAKLLARRSNLTVFTASLMAAEVLARGRPTVFLVGGRVRIQEMSLIGPLAREVVGHFHYDVFLLGAAGWSVEQGLTDFSMDDVDVKHALIEASKQVVAVVDSSKYGMTSLTAITAIDDVDLIITDDGLDPTLRPQIEELTRLQIAPAQGAEGRLA